jgi:Short C-terminal domain
MRPFTSLLTLASTSSGGDKSNRLFKDVYPWLIVLVGVVLVGGVVIYLVRRYMRSAADSSSSGAGFSLQDLRDLHAAGELSDDEFQRAKAQMIGRLQGPKVTDSTADAASSEPSTDDAPPGNSAA